MLHFSFVLCELYLPENALDTYWEGKLSFLFMMTSADYNEIGLIKAEVKQFILKKLFLDTLLSKTLNKIF